MAKASEVQDPIVRAALEEADRLIGEGAYAQAARRCAETYLALLQRRPDIMPPPSFDPTHAPQLVDNLPPNPQGAIRPGWPPLGGIRIAFDEEKKPYLSFEKERFSFSEAVGYFEFTVEQVVRVQREEAPA